jgi:putative phosphotransacetylase
MGPCGLRKAGGKIMKILCEVSVRHAHLSEADLKALFGKDATLEVVKIISQPGQYLSDKKIDLIGPKRTIERVSVLGPTRPETQVEISTSDCFTLGLKDIPVRGSGDLKGTPGMKIRAGDKTLDLEKGVIIIQRHVHIDPETAEKHGFKDGDVVSLKIEGERGGVLSGVTVRTGKGHFNAVHLDSDEGNALGVGCEAEIIR